VRHFRLSVLLFSLILAFAGSALADTVNMTFLGPAGNNSGGVYTFPYEFSVNGGAPVALICDAFDNEVVAGETWQATASPFLSAIPSGGSAMWNGQTSAYKAAGLIFEGILNGSIDANIGNWASGDCSLHGTEDPFFQSNHLANMDLTYQLLGSVTPNSAFQGLVLYTPVAGTQSWVALRRNISATS